MFYYLDNLKSADLSKLDTSKVTDMGAMFDTCSSLTRLDVSGFDTSNVYDMSWMFAGCSSLTRLDVSGFDTSNVEDMSDMFYKCGGLTKIVLPANFYKVIILPACLKLVLLGTMMTATSIPMSPI